MEREDRNNNLISKEKIVLLHFKFIFFMKKVLFYALFLLFGAISCKKSSPSTGDNNNNDTIPTPTVEKFMSYSAGSVWNYQTINNDSVLDITNYTLTCSNIDTLIGGKSYRIFYSSDTSGTTEEYYNNTGRDYFQYARLSDLLPELDMKYLNDSLPALSNWTSQPISITQQVTVPPFPNPINVTITASLKTTLEEKGGSLIVNGTTYNNVIKVKTELVNITTSPSLITVAVESQSIHNYFAPKYGRIKGDFQMHVTATGYGDVINTNTSTTLLSATIQ